MTKKNVTGRSLKRVAEAIVEQLFNCGKKKATEVLDKDFNRRKNNVVNLNNFLVQIMLRIFLIEFPIMANMAGVALNQMHQFIMMKDMRLIIMKMIKLKSKSKKKENNKR